MAVVQANPTRQPFRIEVSGAEVTNGSGGVLFSNAGAELSVEDLVVRKSTLVSVVSTANSLQSEASSFLRRILVTDSAITVSVSLSLSLSLSLLKHNPSACFDWQLSHSNKIAYTKEHILDAGVGRHRCHGSQR
jgi:hypothetical protein